MSDERENSPPINVECPCCGTTLVIDAGRGIVLDSREPVHARKKAELKDAQNILKEETSRIQERYQQIVEAEKGRGTAMDKKFKDFLEKAKDEPTSKPVRDIDLD